MGTVLSSRDMERHGDGSFVLTQTQLLVGIINQR